MTPSTADRPDMLIQEFEQLARTAPETVTLEFIKGKLEVKPVPDGDHGEIFIWLQDQCMQHRPDLRVYPDQGLKVESYRKGRARPDGALAPHRHFRGRGEWSDPEGVLMAVEITSYDADTDRHDKRDGYAEAGIPVYLLVDRDDRSVTVYSDPQGGKYRSIENRPYGAAVKLPEPVGLTLETEELQSLVD
ncbi:Uma2 family endonuclease [Streptomyces gamaensis]|uniref:Uma2 family endonuclease n=1 Tax=Streptomyces gamaensis TaxID=1763542 RepID=A0ABW0YUC1_9ACTN